MKICSILLGLGENAGKLNWVFLFLHAGIELIDGHHSEYKLLFLLTVTEIITSWNFDGAYLLMLCA